jgi:hypothetical protein
MGIPADLDRLLHRLFHLAPDIGLFGRCRRRQYQGSQGQTGKYFPWVLHLGPPCLKKKKPDKPQAKFISPETFQALFDAHCNPALGAAVRIP